MLSFGGGRQRGRLKRNDSSTLRIADVHSVGRGLLVRTTREVL
jgi:hypothetical protein